MSFLDGFGIWPWIVLFMGLFIGFIALVVLVIVFIKLKKYLIPILIYIPFLLFSLALIGVFVFQVVRYAINENKDDYLNYNYNYTYDDYNYNSNYNSNLNTTNDNSNTNSNTNTDLNTNLNLNLNSNTNSSDDWYDYEDGIIYNDDYGFSVDVGKKHESKIWVSDDYWTEDPWFTNRYVFCYQSEDLDYYEYDCGTGWATTFDISVYDETQWADMADSVYSGTLMGQDGGYYFVLSHPNGILPDDVPTSNEFYEKVINSIDFAD